MRQPGRVTSWLRWILAPAFAFLAFGAWALASPVGAAPDDDFHLVSIWCANGGSEFCEPGSSADTRLVAIGFKRVACYGQKPEESAACQAVVWRSWSDESVDNGRGNFYGEYPPVYYATQRVLAGEGVQASAITMRMVNAAIFVGLATALAALLTGPRRRTLLWAWLVTLVPLGMFLIPSNNPSGWAVTGVGTAFLALLGWFESSGRRQWALGALYIVGLVMAAGARGDAAVYVAGATAAVLILTATRSRDWSMRAILPAVGLLIAFGFFLSAGQAGVGASGFTSDGIAPAELGGEGSIAQTLSGFPLAAYNLLMLPFLWTGVWGTWALGWLDTSLPAVVPWAAVSAFVVVAFAGLGQLAWRKAISVAGVLSVLVALPVYVLTVGGDAVGENLQPRYLLPLIVLFAFLLIHEPAGRALRFTRVQTVAIMGALAVANLIALQVNIRRYVTGADEQGLDLGAGAEWWWEGLPLGPMAVWLLGAASFVGLLVAVWPVVRSAEPAAATRRLAAPQAPTRSDTPA